MEKINKIFPKGMFFEKRAGSPDFVIGSISIKVPDFIPFIQQNQNNAGYVNIDLLTSAQSGKPYLALNTYKPKLRDEVEDNQSKLNDTMTTAIDGESINVEDIPF